MRTIVRLTWLGGALLALSPPASAYTSESQMNVTAVVMSGCTLGGGSLNFGQYASGQTSDLDVVGQISYTSCSGQITVELNGGQAGNASSREMSSSAGKLKYQIYRNPAHTSVWGSGADGQIVQLLLTQSGKLDVYGRIPAGQQAVAGSYSDVVNVTMTF